MNWHRVTLGEVLRRRMPDVVVDPSAAYQFAGVYSFGRGVFRGTSRNGNQFSYGTLTRLRQGEFLYPKLMAWEGAFGIVPPECDGCYVSPEFPVFEINTERALPEFLSLYFQIPAVWRSVSGMSIGTNVRRRRLNPGDFLNWTVPLPSMEEQRRISNRVRAVNDRLSRVTEVVEEQEILAKQMLLAEFSRISAGPKRRMSEIAPIVRRPVAVDASGVYAELGIRSFGNGTFHKPALTGAEVGQKRVFRIEPGDLLFSNVFAWEGAIAVARPEDANRVGSHRYITCVPRQDLATPDFLCFYFLTPEGLAKVMEASPGGAGRNRTLGLQRLEEIEVPVPKLEAQFRFDRLQVKLREVKRHRTWMAGQIDRLIATVRDQAFGEVT